MRDRHLLIRQGRQRGQALVPVIFVMLILTVLAVAFAMSSGREVRASSNFVAESQRFYAARGALNYAAAALAQTSNNGATYGVVPPAPDTDANGWQQIGDAWVKIEVTDTAACVNLNTVDQNTLNLLPVFRDNSDLVAAIMDWRSQGDQPSQNGAKSDYYQSLPTPYNCKNGPFDTVEELLLVKGMTPTLLYGNAVGSPIPTGPDDMTSNVGNGRAGGGNGRYGQTRQAGTLGNNTGNPQQPGNGQPNGNNPGTQNPNNADGQNPDNDFSDIFNNSRIPLAELFTAFSRERNVSADGTARVNVMSATQQDLQDKLGLTAAQASALITARTGGGTNSAGSGINTSNYYGLGSNNLSNTDGSGQDSSGQNGNGPGLRMKRYGGLGRPRGGRPGLRMPRYNQRGVTRQSAPLGLGSSGGLNSGGTNPGGSSSGNTIGSGNPGGNLPGGNTLGSGNPSGGGSGGVQNLGDLLKANGLDLSLIQSIADKIAFDDKPDRENVINVNTAPAEVLATVPGMDRTTLNAILSYRQSGKAFQTMGDFLALEGVTQQQLAQVAGHLSAKSSLYVVHIKVRTAGQPGVYAVSALVELTQYGPRVLQWREVPRTPGWSSWQAPPTLPTPQSSGR